MIIMKGAVVSVAMIAFTLLALACLVSPAMAGPGASISGTIAYINGRMPDDTTVSLVNASNTSQYITGYNTTAVNGHFQFINVPLGFYAVYASSPHYSDGFSQSINITSNDTYTASIVLQPVPYYANLTASPMHLTYGGTSDVTATVYDYWGNPVGAGWQILFHTSAGWIDPQVTVTDTNSKAYSHVSYVENASSADIRVYFTAPNGSSYTLLSNMTALDVTPTPSAVPSVSATPTASPTVSPNATATAVPSATVSPSGMRPVPGFELVVALAALGILAAAWKRK